MPQCSLVFLGGPDKPDGDAEELLHEGEPLQAGAVLPLERKRSPWKRLKDTERVIVGSHPGRADVLLVGEGIFPEHVRFYLNTEGGPTDLRSMNPGSTRLGGTPVEALEWTYLHGGEEIELGSWRFRYERV